MQPAPVTKYRPFPPVNLPNRQWPNRVLSRSPIWCSVDLRDGNQALAQPMSVEEKLEYFEMLVRIGFKELDLGSGGKPHFDFLEADADEHLEVLELFLDTHGLGEGLVAIAEIDAAPDGGAGERAVGPL